MKKNVFNIMTYNGGDHWPWQKAKNTQINKKKKKKRLSDVAETLYDC